MARYIYFVFFSALILLTSQISFKKIIPNFDPEARCLDGSPALLYAYEGDPKNILIYFEAGSTCGDQSLVKTLENCYQRSKSLLGSSKSWPEDFPLNSMQGFLSPDPQQNTFANWTKFVFGYCDGALHQGYSKDPVKYKDLSMYFRGSTITKAHFNWINSKYNLKGADKIILTGKSAGGIAANMWSNYLKTYVQSDSKVYPIPDSGVYINVATQLGDPAFQNKLENIFKVSNGQEATPNEGCNNANRGSEWKCFFMENLYPHLKGKFMIINSQANAYDLAKLDFEKCLKRKGTSKFSVQKCSFAQVNYVEKYIDAYREVLSKFSEANNEVSIWSKECPPFVNAKQILYYDSPLERVPAIASAIAREAIDSFVLQNKVSVVYEPNCWQTNEDFTNY